MMRQKRPLIAPLFTLISLFILLVFIFIFDFYFFVIPSFEYNRFFVYAIGYSFIAVLVSLLIWFSYRNDSKSVIPYTLQFSLGGLWLADGILQLQPQMPYEFLSLILFPVISGIQNPSLSSFLMIGYNTWMIHPYQFNAISGALQIFIGVSFILIRSERALKIVSIISFLWGIIIWIFGEGFGGIFAGNPSYLTGYPGSALIYSLMSIPFFINSLNNEKNISKFFNVILVVFLLTSSILQALPGSGFWAYNNLAGIPYNLMFNQGEPIPLAYLLNAIYPIISIYGFYFNIIFVSVPLALCLAIAGKRKASYLLTAAYIFSIWVIFQDMGIYVNPSTDPNTALPVVLILFYMYFHSLGTHEEVSTAMENKIS